MTRAEAIRERYGPPAALERERTCPGPGRLPAGPTVDDWQAYQERWERRQRAEQLLRAENAGVSDSWREDDRG